MQVIIVRIESTDSSFQNFFEVLHHYFFNLCHIMAQAESTFALISYKRITIMRSHVIFREYIWLVNTIHRCGRISLEEINREWLRTDMSEGLPMARSTFNRHKNAIENIFGIYIECDRTDGYRYYIGNVEVLEENTIQNWMLSTLSVNNILAESKGIHDRILLESIPSDGENLHKPPYINHPIRVMKMGKIMEEKIAGVLHDVVEDSEWTFEILEKEGIPKDVIDALKCVTKLSEDEEYDHFIERVKTNPLAVKVKLIDIRDNLDVTRLDELTEKDLPRLNKYIKAFGSLSQIL